MPYDTQSSPPRTSGEAVLLPEDVQTLSRLADPFAGVFFVQKILLGLLGTAFLGLVAQGILLYRLGQDTTAHVYEVHPDGQAHYIGARQANLMPREEEVRWIAKTFVTRLYAWNSSTIAADIAEAVTMCNDAMATQLRQEFADAQFIEHIRAIQVRSEMTFEHVDLLDFDKRTARIAVQASVQRYGLSQYAGAPFERRTLDVEVVLSVVPRAPDGRTNGLEVVRLFQRDENSFSTPLDNRSEVSP